MANQTLLSLPFALALILAQLPRDRAMSSETRFAIAQPLPPAAPLLNDEGGPTRLTGRGTWTSLEIPMQYDSPVVVLRDRGATLVQRNASYFAPATGQIFGEMSSEISTPPFTYTLELPPVPPGQYYDVDNNNRQDPGVQIWAVTLANNAIRTPNEPFLSPVEQLTQLSVPISSLATAPPTSIDGIAQTVGGTLLVYAAEPRQGFPSGFGTDGRLFTADDPIVTLPPGYTVVRLEAEGFKFDRAREANIPLVERVADSKTDFSHLSYTEAFNALIDLLKARYAYTQLRDIDWEALRRQYLPQMEVAEEKGDAVAYFAILDAIAREVKDAHVQVLGAPQLLSPLLQAQLQGERASLGIEGVELNDGRILIQQVLPDSPAERAGIEALGELLAVNGIPMSDRISQLLAESSRATAETRRLDAIARSLAFAPGERATLRYRNATGEIEETTLTAEVPPRRGMAHSYPASRTLTSPAGQTYGYFRLSSFLNSTSAIARFSDFLKTLNQREIPGLVIDLRDNGGGSVALLVSLLSFFWSAENPLLLDDTFSQRQDIESGNAIAYGSFEIPPDFPIFAPTPDLHYSGSVVILVGENCLSACEFFADWMQRYERATVIGTRATGGAGGSVTWVPLPEEALFTYTYTREVDRRGKPYIEGRGVQPTERVPLTQQSVRAMGEGEDPVLEAALKRLDRDR
ncbi:MAG: S41 family peptidase [Cyanobacteriota bacterium]|nr:S41 family peptidase [Cyanobacteriota bacterium]